MFICLHGTDDHRNFVFGEMSRLKPVNQRLVSARERREDREARERTTAEAAVKDKLEEAPWVLCQDQRDGTLPWPIRLGFRRMPPRAASRKGAGASRKGGGGHGLGRGDAARARARADADDINESDFDECVVDVKKAELHMQDKHEAKLLIEKLNQSGLGEDISDKEFLAYFDQLASGPPWIDLKAGLTDEDLDQQYVDHALYRFRYYKYKLSQPKEELHDDTDNLLEEGEDDKEEREYLAMLKEKQLLYREEGDTTSEEDDNLTDKTEADNLMDKTEADFNLEFLEENRFFITFERDGTLDWFFYPAYCECASLSDYERLVLKNYGGTEYSRWSEYHSYLHSYDVELEYVKYCEELSKQLKWMEDYVDIDPSSLKWDYISSRGAYQAIKIAATSFPKITPTLAYLGYNECKESMGYHHMWLKEYDGLYFEIWRRVKKGMSFRAALEDVCVLNRFPLRQSLMQTALGHEFTMRMLEKDFRTCTAAIRPGVEEDEAKELIADAVKKRVDKPKFYEDYIRKKIEIAHIVGILPSE